MTIDKIAICGDISEMFHSIKIREADMHVQRFLWNETNGETPDVYVMSAMTFGIRCAPCIAHYVRDKNAESFSSQLPRAAMAIRERHYVDDFIDSVDSEKSAIELALQVKKIHFEGGFQIRNWTSNSTKILEALKTERPEQITFSLSQNEKVLGMYWDSYKDNFKYIAGSQG